MLHTPRVSPCSTVISFVTVLSGWLYDSVLGEVCIDDVQGSDGSFRLDAVLNTASKQTKKQKQNKKTNKQKNPLTYGKA